MSFQNEILVSWYKFDTIGTKMECLMIIKSAVTARIWAARVGRNRIDSSLFCPRHSYVSFFLSVYIQFILLEKNVIEGVYLDHSAFMFLENFGQAEICEFKPKIDKIFRFMEICRLILAILPMFSFHNKSTDLAR